MCFDGVTAEEPAKFGVCGELALVEPLIRCVVVREHVITGTVCQQPVRTPLPKNSFREDKCAGPLFLRKSRCRGVGNPAPDDGAVCDSAVKSRERVAIAERATRAGGQILHPIVAGVFQFDLHTKFGLGQSDRIGLAAEQRRGISAAVDAEDEPAAPTKCFHETEIIVVTAVGNLDQAGVNGVMA